MEQVAEKATEQNYNFNYQELTNLAIERPKAVIEGLICERQNALLMGRVEPVFAPREVTKQEVEPTVSQ